MKTKKCSKCNGSLPVYTTRSGATTPPRLEMAHEGMHRDDLPDRLDEEGAEEMLLDLLGSQDVLGQEGLGQYLRKGQTFESAGVLTTDRGLVFKLADGRSLYLTIQVQG